MRTFLLFTMLVLASGAFPPQAAAHQCTLPNAAYCGGCDDGLWHDHRYTDGRVYCQSYYLPHGWICTQPTPNTWVCANPGWVESLLGGPPEVVAVPGTLKDSEPMVPLFA